MSNETIKNTTIEITKTKTRRKGSNIEKEANMLNRVQ
jgi:hypothetical protein